jgi:hypothetical protein
MAPWQRVAIAGWYLSFCYSSGDMNTDVDESSITKVPVELWTEIFWFAAAIAGKDDLSCDGLAYDILPREETGISSVYNSSELSQLLAERHKIIHVCRSWYAIGIKSLWSHLIIRPSITEQQLHRLHKILKTRTHLAAAVIRLTIQFDSDTEFRKSARENILPLLHNLRIISYPFGSIDKTPMATVQVATVFNLRGFLPMRSYKFGDCWKSLQTLCVTVEFPHHQPDVVSLPNLRHLRLIRNDQSGDQRIATHWKLPNLQTLSIQSILSNFWSDLLRSCRGTLEQLEISVPNVYDTEEIVMPRLSFLLISSLYAEGWLPYIKAAHLSRVALSGVDFIYEFRSDPNDVIRTINSIFSSYKTLTSLCIYEEGRYLSPKTKYGIMEKDIESLGSSGIMIQIRHGIRDRREHAIYHCSRLARVVSIHPELRHHHLFYRTTHIFAPHKSSLEWMVVCAIGKYRVCGAVKSSQHMAQESSAAFMLEQIEEDTLI